MNDSTTVNGAHSSGYGDFYWNNQATTPGWRVWNGSSYDVGFSSRGSGGSGDVVGPASAVDNQIAVFNGTTGKLIKDGGQTISALPFIKTAGTSTLTGTTTITTGTTLSIVGTAADPTLPVLIGKSGAGNLTFSNSRIILNNTATSKHGLQYPVADGSYVTTDSTLTNKGFNDLTYVQLATTASALSDGATIAITGAKYTLNNDTGHDYIYAFTARGLLYVVGNI